MNQNASAARSRQQRSKKPAYRRRPADEQTGPQPPADKNAISNAATLQPSVDKSLVNVPAWQPPSATKPSRKAAKFLAGLAAAAVTAQYLAGYIFLWSINADPRTASPLTIAKYAYHHGARTDIRTRLIASSLSSAGVLALGALPVLLPRRRSLHGDARFATHREIAAAGLLGDRGIILGQLGGGFGELAGLGRFGFRLGSSVLPGSSGRPGRPRGRCLMLAGQQGVALAAPPRAGKGTGVVIPNLLNWPDSLVCIDIKKENWTLTAGFRQHAGQQCFLFDPFAEDGRTARWNPFFYVSADPQRRINDLQRIAEMLYPDPPNVDPFWTASARSLFLGIALYLFETPSLPTTVGEVLRQGMASDAEGFGHHWKRIIEGRNSGRYPLSPQCVRALYDIIDLAPVTASSIRKTFTSRLDLWLNPILDAATSGNDFDLRKLRFRPMSIYVGVNPDDLHRLRHVLNLFFEQAIGLQTRELPERNPALKYQVMMLLDEFTALGRIPIIAESISYLPGFNVRVVLVIQTPAQLRDVYGPNNAETMLKSLAARIVFAPKDYGDAKEISDELGFTTVKVKSYSKPAMPFFSSAATSPRQRTMNVSDQRRALMLAQEVKALGKDNALVFCEGLPPIQCKKIRYFDDPRFTSRLLPPPSTPAPPAAQPVSPLSPPASPRANLAPPLSAAAANNPAAAARLAAANTTAAAVVHATAADSTIANSAPTAPLELTNPGLSEPPQLDKVSTVRDARIADLERLDELKLEDFAVDFSRVELPEKQEGERLTDRELHVAVESFLASLRE